MKQLFSRGRTWCCLLFCCQSALALHAQSVGVGTHKPSANAALDVYSTNKGLMFPRVDTAAVANPSAGLLIYSQQLKAPAYHNGTRWNTLAGGAGTAATGPAAAANVQAPTSIAYTIDDGTGGFARGTLTSIISLAQGISADASVQGGTGVGVGRASFGTLNLLKALDANSVPFTSALANGRHIKSITFEVYYSPGGVSTPYYSIKLTGAVLTSYQVSFDTQATEQLSFVAATFQYQNYVTKQTFAWDVTKNVGVK